MTHACLNPNPFVAGDTMIKIQEELHRACECGESVDIFAMTCCILRCAVS